MMKKYPRREHTSSFWKWMKPVCIYCSLKKQVYPQWRRWWKETEFKWRQSIAIRFKDLWVRAHSLHAIVFLVHSYCQELPPPGTLGKSTNVTKKLWTRDQSLLNSPRRSMNLVSMSLMRKSGPNAYCTWLHTLINLNLQRKRRRKKRKRRKKVYAINYQKFTWPQSKKWSWNWLLEIWKLRCWRLRISDSMTCLTKTVKVWWAISNPSTKLSTTTLTSSKLRKATRVTTMDLLHLFYSHSMLVVFCRVRKCLPERDLSLKDVHQ